MMRRGRCRIYARSSRATILPVVPEEERGEELDHHRLKRAQTYPDPDLDLGFELSESIALRLRTEGQQPGTSTVTGRLMDDTTETQRRQAAGRPRSSSDGPTSMSTTERSQRVLYLSRPVRSCSEETVRGVGDDSSPQGYQEFNTFKPPARCRERVETCTASPRFYRVERKAALRNLGRHHQTTK